MTSVTQIVGPPGGGAPGFGAAAIRGRSEIGEPESDGERGPSLLRGQDGREAEQLPGRRAQAAPESVPSARGEVRLPGQEGLPEGGPRRPLIAGGAFTLAVAIGLSLDQQARPDGLEPATPASGGEAAPAEGPEEGAAGIDGLTEAEREVVRELQQRDAEVRRHEAAHAAAGGQYAGAPSFSYQTGPDGKRYAVGGSVSIDTAPIKGDPEATLRKAQQIRAAANAPADPSAQDRRVAAQADSLRQQAQAELATERREERQTEEAEAAAAEAERAAQQGAGASAPGPATAEGPSASGPAPQAGIGTGFRDAGADEPADAGFGPTSSLDPAEPDPAGGGSAEERFAPGAFSGAAARYRGLTPAPSLVSIAV